jgi:hypothetical protein
MATQQSSQVSASAFFPHAEVSERGVEGAGVVGSLLDELLAPGVFVEPLGVRVLSAAVLAFFDEDVGTGSAPLQPIAASATNEERQRAMQETCFMGDTHCRLQAGPGPMCAHPKHRKNGAFTR